MAQILFVKQEVNTGAVGGGINLSSKEQLKHLGWSKTIDSGNSTS